MWYSFPICPGSIFAECTGTHVRLRRIESLNQCMIGAGQRRTAPGSAGRRRAAPNNILWEINWTRELPCECLHTYQVMYIWFSWILSACLSQQHRKCVRSRAAAVYVVFPFKEIKKLRLICSEKLEFFRRIKPLGNFLLREFARAMRLWPKSGKSWWSICSTWRRTTLFWSRPSRRDRKYDWHFPLFGQGVLVHFDEPQCQMTYFFAHQGLRSLQVQTYSCTKARKGTFCPLAVYMIAVQY